MRTVSPSVATGANLHVPMIAATAVARPACASGNPEIRHRAQAEPATLDNDVKRAQVTENNTGILADPHCIDNYGVGIFIEASGSSTQHAYIC